jgi:hypothetical protein
MSRSETLVAWTLGGLGALAFALVPAILTATSADAVYWQQLYVWILT